MLNAIVLTAHAQTSKKLEDQRSMTIKTRSELQGTSQRLERLSTEKKDVESSLREVRTEKSKLQQENRSLKVNLQAKRQREAEAARLASVQSEPVQETVAAVKPAPTVKVSGDKQSWLAASGIPSNEWASVDFIVTRESGWNPNAVNPSSGACGLGQQLPCGKWAGAWNDPVAALRAQYGYVKERYGGYPQAVAFWQANHWY